jgi:PEP-CTERM motif
VITVDGNRFYDLNHNELLDAGDFDLIDDPEEGTHAPADSGDLMQPSNPQGQRNHPTLDHAQVLGDAYGYEVVPEPSTMLLVATGIAGMLRCRSRRHRTQK